MSERPTEDDIRALFIAPLTTTTETPAACALRMEVQRARDAESAQRERAEKAERLHNECHDDMEKAQEQSHALARRLAAMREALREIEGVAIYREGYGPVDLAGLLGDVQYIAQKALEADKSGEGTAAAPASAKGERE